jgi:hypothetical protein
MCVCVCVCVRVCVRNQMILQDMIRHDYLHVHDMISGLNDVNIC